MKMQHSNHRLHHQSQPVVELLLDKNPANHLNMDEPYHKQKWWDKQADQVASQIPSNSMAVAFDWPFVKQNRVSVGR